MRLDYKRDSNDWLILCVNLCLDAIIATTRVVSSPNLDVVLCDSTAVVATAARWVDGVLADIVDAQVFRGAALVVPIDWGGYWQVEVSGGVQERRVAEQARQSNRICGIVVLDSQGTTIWEGSHGIDRGYREGAQERGEHRLDFDHCSPFQLWHDQHRN